MGFNFGSLFGGGGGGGGNPFQAVSSIVQAASAPRRYSCLECCEDIADLWSSATTRQRRCCQSSWNHLKRRTHRVDGTSPVWLLCRDRSPACWWYHQCSCWCSQMTCGTKTPLESWMVGRHAVQGLEDAIPRTFVVVCGIEVE